MPDPPKFSFGQTSGNATSGSLFGSADASKPASLFGSSTGNAPGSGGTSLFGQPAQAGGSSPSVFGQAPPSSGAGFSFGQKKDKEGATGGSLFGQATSSAPSFSLSKPGENNAASTPTATKPVFGAPAASPQPSPGSLFGGLSKPAEGSDNTSTPAANKTSAPFSFSTTPAGVPPGNNASNLFGGAKPGNSGSSLFGQKADKPATAPSGGLFAAAKSPSEQQPASPAPGTSSLFGTASVGQDKPNLFAKPAAPASAASGETPKPTFSFPAPKAPGASEGSQDNKPTFSLGKPTGSSAASPAPAAPAATSSLFGNLGKPSSTGATPTAPGTLSLGQKKDDAAPAPNAQTSTLFGTPKKDDSSAAPTANAPAASGLFKIGQPVASTSTTTAPAASSAPLFGAKPATEASGNTAGTATGASTLGASTAGPAPPAASRLASKSLDEILTLWTTSLTSHQKSFGKIADQISLWDRQLVENSNKISKLYARTFQAERDTAEVERQLSQVEGEQQELERYLDQYERQVDELIARNGGVEGGVDAERERTYRIAERCSTRLTSMSHDLTSMIEEINSASAHLRQSSKSANAQDPLTQIVKVLNGHLSQLQIIDQGANALQQKVTAAQREARSYGRNGGLGNDEVDAFAKSYLGRR